MLPCAHVRHLGKDFSCAYVCYCACRTCEPALNKCIVIQKRAFVLCETVDVTYILGYKFSQCSGTTREICENQSLMKINHIISVV